MADVAEFLEDIKDFVLEINVGGKVPWHGNLYHKIKKQKVRFDSLLEMAWLVEDICDHTGIPKASVELRRFKNGLYDQEEGNGGSSAYCSSPEEGGARALLFRLHLQYRSNASWQGWLESIDTGSSAGFNSFLNLAEQLCGVLWKETYGEELTAAEVEETISYEGIPADERGLSSIRKEPGESSIGRLLWLVTGKKTRFSGHSGILWLPGKRGSFQVDIKFQRNHTWQGTARWLEKKEELQFRSFLELLKITDVEYQSPGTEE